MSNEAAEPRQEKNSNSSKKPLINGGFIVVPRAVGDLPPRLRLLFLEIFLHMAYKPMVHLPTGRTIQAGQYYTSYSRLSKALGLTRKQCRDDVAKLERMWSQLSHEVVNKLLLFSYVGFDKTQALASYSSRNGHDEGTIKSRSGHDEGKSITSLTADTAEQPLADPQADAAPPASQRKNKKPPPDPGVRTFIDFAHTTHQEELGAPLHVDGGKDGMIVKRLLKTYGLEALQRMWGKYLRDDDDWVRKNGISIGGFKVHIARYVTGAGAPRLKCALCSGTGEYGGEVCPQCGGTRKI